MNSIIKKLAKLFNKNNTQKTCSCNSEHSSQTLKQLGDTSEVNINYHDSVFTTNYLCEKCKSKWENIIIGNYHCAKENKWKKLS